MKSEAYFKIEDDTRTQNPADNEVATSKDVVDKGKEFFDTHRAFFEHYAHDASIEVAPPMPGESFAIDLEKGTMYTDINFFTEKGYSPDKCVFATCHELEHFKEMKELLSEKEGEKIWKRHNDKRRQKQRFNIMDNCFDDVKMNRSVLSHVPTLGHTKDNLYKENLFPALDYTDVPKHLQFSYALLREAMIESESLKLDAEVRSEIDRLRGIKNENGVSLLDYASHPDTPMSTRLKLQEAFLEPVLEKLFEKDLKKKKEDEEKNDKASDKNKKGEGKESDVDSKNKDDTQKSKQKSKSQPPKKPEDYFKKDYEKYHENNPQPVNQKQIEDAIKKYIDAQKDKKTIDQLTEEAYAKAEGVTYEELSEYRRFWQEIKNIKNPETDESVVEELRNVFRRIIAERKKPKLSSKLPEKEGDLLAFPAEAVVAIKSGSDDPEVWQTLEVKEKPKELYGNFDITFVGDRSGSMSGQKAIEQRKAAALILESLKEFSDDVDKTHNDLTVDLHIRTECWSFGDKEQVEVLKPLSKELTEKQRVHVFKTLADTPGSTKDFLALEQIHASISAEDIEKIKTKKLKKIIIVTSDGQSDDSGRLQRSIQDLREKGITVVGVGITTDGEAVKSSYAPDGQVCKETADLPAVLGELLKRQLADL